MSVYVYRARRAESMVEHEIRMHEMDETKRAVALRSGRIVKRDARRVRHAAVSMREAEMNWTAAAVYLLTWGLS